MAIIKLANHEKPSHVNGWRSYRQEWLIKIKKNPQQKFAILLSLPFHKINKDIGINTSQKWVDTEIPPKIPPKQGQKYCLRLLTWVGINNLKLRN